MAGKKRGSKAAPEGETKRQKFERLGSARMSKVLKAIGALGNLSGSSYEYKPEDVEKMRTAIQEATKNSLARFVPKVKGEAEKPAFTF